MRLAELKSGERLGMQAPRLVRGQLAGERASLMSQIRSLLLERGRIVPQGRARLAPRLAEPLDGQTPVLGPRIHALLLDMRDWTCGIGHAGSDMRDRWMALDRRIAKLDKEFA